MSMFPHTITLYVSSVLLDPSTFHDEEITNITVLDGVLLDASKAANVRASGLVGADSANLYIPFGVKATDGETGEEKTYLDRVEYLKSAEPKKHYTFFSSDAGQTNKRTYCFFVKGRAVHPGFSFEQISAMYADVYTITSIDEKDFGGLQHWEIGAH